MSSNAFARSRPRVRHQRVPKSQSYNHPRFLQLCKELDRLDELKRNSDGSDDSGGSASKDDCCSNKCSIITSSKSSNDDCSTTNDSNSLNYCTTDHRSPPTQPITSCASMIDNFVEAHSSNGFRSLGCAPTTRYDDYYRQSNSNLIQNHHHYLQDRCGNNLSINQRQYHLQEPNQMSNNSSSGLNSHAHQLLAPSCPNNKFASMSAYQLNSSSPRVNSKIIAPAHGCSDLTTASRSNENPDLNRQDENRSKRKRPSNDPSSNGSKKLSSANGSISPACVANSKRHKSSPEPSRPLSPSFTKCPICLLDCMDRDPSFTNTCFHLFCYVCIENWSKSKATCPLCRTKFTKIIYNIKSAGCYDEKIASPIRRDDEDERVIFDYGLIPPHFMPQQAPLRNQHQNDVSPRLSFDNINRSNDVLMPSFPFVSSQIDYQPLEGLHPFNTITNTNTVPHTSPFSSYNPYITLIPATNSSARIHQPATNTAIASAYSANPVAASLNGAINNASDSSSDNSGSRMPRASRSGRYVAHPRVHNLTSTINDSSLRASRSSNASIAPGGTSITLERHNYHVQPHNQHNRHSVVVGAPPTVSLVPRSTNSTLELNTLNNSVINPNTTIRQSSHRMTLNPYNNLAYTIEHPLSSYSRRPYPNMHVVDQHIFSSIYGASQEPML